MKEREPIHVRGFRNGLYITVDESVPDEELVERLHERLKSLGAFVKGSSVLLEIGARTLNDDALRSLQKMFQREYGLSISQLISRSDRSRHAADILRIRSAPTLLQPETSTEQTREPNTVTIRNTLRSGAHECYLEGNILVLGDVNPGAELIASGDIIVLGALRGVVHAGAMGDEKALVIAFSLQPTQLRIAHYIARAPEGLRRGGFHPEMASVVEGQIVVRPFTGF